MPVKLVEVTRANIVESVHMGDLAVADSRGNLLFELGNHERITFMRSSAKPLQAVAVLECGIAEKYNLDLKEIAVIASSHSGETEHIKTLEGIMEKIGIKEIDLVCGAHPPLGKEAAMGLAASGKQPTKLHCNCSGKHLGILAACMLKGYPIKGYQDINHPIQEHIRKVISEFSGIDVSRIIMGVDGCGLPVHGLPLKNMALAYANLCDENFMGGKYGKSQNYVLSAMTMYPEMVAGKDRLDTVLMKSFGDRLIGKMGAEGVYCAGILKKGIGITLKIEDGNGRAVGPAIIEVLVQMGILSKDEGEKVGDMWKPVILNHAGERVGSLRPDFKLPVS